MKPFESIGKENPSRRIEQPPQTSSIQQRLSALLNQEKLTFAYRILFPLSVCVRVCVDENKKMEELGGEASAPG